MKISPSNENILKAYKEVLDFWYSELAPSQWFKVDISLDKHIRDRFIDIHNKAIQGELYVWRSAIEGRLAEIIVLDQFSRNIFRGKPESFSTDGMALVLAQEAINSGLVDDLEKRYQEFFLMPYMHSESREIHEIALALRKKYHLDTDYEVKHKVIVDRFGRYPHRNRILNRASTEEELSFLDQENSSF